MGTTEQPTLSTAIESMQAGHRYLATVAPSYNHGWTVASVEHHESRYQVLRDGQWTAVHLVTVTYHNGRSITEEIGTAIAIDCDV